MISILISSLFPYLCEVRADFNQLKRRYLSSLRTIIFVIVPLVILQSFAAPFYVPIIFGSQWDSAIPILQTICLSAIPLAISFSVMQLLSAVDKTRLNLIWNGIYTLLFAIAIFASAKIGLMTVAIAVLIAQMSTLLFSAWAINHVFRKA